MFGKRKLLKQLKEDAEFINFLMTVINSQNDELTELKKESFENAKKSATRKKSSK